jgi:peptide/nickel transport system substrate-binding protein
MKPERKTKLMRRLHSHRRLLAAATAGLLAAGLAACSSSTSSSGSTSSSASAGTTGKTLVMESSPETAITQDFNPFVNTQAAYGMGADGLIYEPLIQFNMVAPPQYYPWLATSYAWSNGGKTITFAIRQGVKWNNGTAMTPADVAFTFNMLKKYPAVNLDGLKIQTVSTSGNNVVLTFPSAQYTNLQSIAGTAIVPQAVWSTVGNPATYQDPSPVGTGPYVLKTFTPQGIILTKNPTYWQEADIQVPTVDFPVYTSNTGALAALFAGQIDWTGNFIPGLQQNFVAKDPAHHGYWEAPGGTNSLMPNLNKWPTNQLPVRQAISLAINRQLLAQEGEAGLEQPVLNSTGMPLPTFQAWVGPVANLTNSATGNPAAAEQVLTKAGFTKGSNGFFAKNGQTVALTIVDPAAYTDYAQVDELVAQQLRAAGIDATFQGLSVNAWNADVADGDFQLTSHWSNGGLTPYNMYDGWLDSSLASGSAATGDYERLNNPTINAELATLAGAADTAAQTQALVPIEQFVASNLPIIPTTTASQWFEYNSQNYTGWPTEQNPYETGQPSGTNNGNSTGTNEVVILHLRPRT